MGRNNIYRTDLGACIPSYVQRNFNGSGKLVGEFLAEKAMDGMDPQTLYKYVKDLRFWKDTLPKHFEECGAEDVREAVLKLHTLPLAESTKQRRKISLKVFFRYLKKTQNPPETSWIKTHMKAGRDMIPPQLLLQPEDVRKMVLAAENPIEKALVSLHWESGGRVGEVLNVQVQDVGFEDGLSVIRLNGKTGPRMIYVCETMRRLEVLMDGREMEDFLFLNKSERPMSYGNFRRVIGMAGSLSGISKPLNTHFFRHSRATFLAKMGWTEAQLCAYFGWVQGSPMARIYVHMAAADLKKKVMEMNGLAG